MTDTQYFPGVPSGLNNVQTINSAFAAFAASRADGTVVAWGDASRGGSNVDGKDKYGGSFTGVPAGLGDVEIIFSNLWSFAALIDDGSVVAWGDMGNGGSRVPAGLTNVEYIYSTNSAYAAVKNDGSVEAWGSKRAGGTGVPAGLTNVRSISATYEAFAALSSDGSVVAWGQVQG